MVGGVASEWWKVGADKKRAREVPLAPSPSHSDLWMNVEQAARGIQSESAVVVSGRDSSSDYSWCTPSVW